MQDETIATAPQGGQPVTHTYYEVGGELFSKPNAISDIVEMQKGASTIIFCNSPSDTDLVEVVLRKRGIPARKLVGHIPPLKVHEARQQLVNGEITALVVTDVSARGLEFDNLNLVINYSLPDDPEIYIHRAAVHTEQSSHPGSRTVASLVSPLDIGNFHYLKKISNIPFSHVELPKAEELLGIKVEQLRKTAVEKAVLNDARIKKVVEQVLASPDRDQLVGLLVHNTLDVLPSLTSSERAAPEREEGRREESGEGEMRRGRDRGGRGERSDRGDRGGRGDRGDRGGRRGSGGRDNRREDNRGNRYNDEESENQRQHARSAQQDSYDEGDYQPRQPRGNDDFGDEGMDQPRRGRRHERGGRDSTPPVRDTRIYLGHGTREGMSEPQLRDLLQKSGELQADQIKRIIVRDAYAFVDVPEEVASNAVQRLEECELSEGRHVFARKAVTISAPREGGKPSDEESGEVAAGGSASHNEGDESFSESAESEQGPTTLDVDSYDQPE